MVQTTLEDIRKNDTAALFRDSADIMAIRPSDAPAASRSIPRSPLLSGNGDDSAPKKFDPNGDSDQAILLRKSGYRQTDEKTTQGYQLEQSENRIAQAAERVAIQRAAEVANATLLQRTRSYIGGICTKAADYISDSISGAAASVSNFVGNAVDKITTTAGNVWSSVKTGAANIGTSISNGFNDYVAKPVSNAYSTASGWVQDKASSAWSSTKSFFGYDDDAKPQAAAAKPAQATTTARTQAEAQPLAGQKNNVSSGFSLSGAFDSAVDGAKDMLGWNTPAPKAAPGIAPR